MKILVAVDGSAYTQRLLEYIASQDAWLGKGHEYHVLHVVLQVPHRAAAFVGADVVRRFHAEDAETVLKPVRAFFEERKIPAEYRWEAGHASKVIAKEAEKGGYDLILMGSHGYGELANVVLGSTATQVLGACRTPVLIVR
jgi:nucleotide-binding universal stress UspA family protein